ncbi:MULTISPECIES: MmgE/PrpD family protein [unclassified Mesorhizobium]|uniref:MmgE/PrpD family protein n=2 Tax=Mesorhizobium TaxID=68287 RepID=UPI000FD26712|nr:MULTISPECIES: MmgE/PrpD family protein [unclassified Mesorhizobium]RUV97433.1 MmgE/PrpD family protein [Mesorhizobium sp. M5C.F.Ca.IN.020.14.1.1]RUV25402.1 MmgE/PrpD family protein [Mesorhizobium sp. M5C.F.Ca.IN.020.32.2.1]RWH55715.1 MAG: MmgE/PrpD family protein [Mesorhizobium sp.]RWI67752.1 MAG: MmgE/PrpD family protein [Mesorhizobium sp.]RWI77708.1 MAG: MmgE/PrpD family protein [Mesorhizobium sp.]
MTNSTAELIAQYTADSRLPPKDVIQQAKLHIADTLACIFAGSSSKTIRILAEANYWAGTPKDVPVPGWGYAKTMDAAAELLGTAAHELDFDDTSVSMPGHPSAPIVAALLVTASDLSANHGRILRGFDFILAYIKGMEVTCKVGKSFRLDHKGQGWHTISTVGLLGAATACAALRGLDALGCERALAIACSHACGILSNSGTMVKPLHSGLAARGGYIAAALAEKQFTAGRDILAGQYGLANAFTGGRHRDVDISTTNTQGSALPPLAGEHFELISPGLKVKLFPCCQVAHTCIDAMITIRNLPDFEIQEVDRIICYVPTEMSMKDLQCPEPQTPTEARFSMNFTVAVAMLHGSLKMEHFNSDLLASESLRQYMRRIEMRLPDETIADTVDVEVIFKDGRRITQRGINGPPKWADVEAKFNECIMQASTPVEPSGLLTVLQQLETQTDVVAVLLK